MQKLEKALLAINASARGSVKRRIPTIAMLSVTVAYLFTVLSVPLYAPQRLVWLAAYPVVMAEATGLGFGKVFVKSLWILPLVFVIGIFNPLFDTQTVMNVGGIQISEGWVSFASILLRGLLAMQATIILTGTAGFNAVCVSLARIGCPRVLVTQLQFTYRYIAVITEEAIWMNRAREARGFGRRNYPLKMWGRFVGQLMARSYERALRVHRAMLSRGFSGVMAAGPREDGNPAWGWAFAIGWILVFGVIRFIKI